MICSFSGFSWMMLFQAWRKKIVKQDSTFNSYLLTLNHHVIKDGRCLCIDKLTSKELHSI